MFEAPNSELFGGETAALGTRGRRGAGGLGARIAVKRLVAHDGGARRTAARAFLVWFSPQRAFAC